MNRIVEHRFSFGFVILLFTWLAAVNVLAAPVVESPVDLVHPLIGSDRCRNFFMTAAGAAVRHGEARA